MSRNPMAPVLVERDGPDQPSSSINNKTAIAATGGRPMAATD